MKRLGYYCWGGPGTIRMINLKFFNPKIDRKSIMNSYEYDYLSKVKDVFGVTDFWATFSWGFNDKTEKEDRQFITERINNFKKLGIKLHAYIQGPNVVTSDFPNVDWYCKDHRGRDIAYYRGRKVVCVNNPGFLEYKLKVINEALKYDFDGIFIDNIQMGQLGLPIGDEPLVFAGCNCVYCQQLYKEYSGKEIPLDFEADKTNTKKYLEFRINSIQNFLTIISETVHSQKKEFGTNSFDPKFDTEYTYGYSIKHIDELQDYILFENHSLPRENKNNHYITKFIKDIKKPVFVVSYKEGIGLDSEFGQEDMNNIYTEDLKERFYAGLKGSEYFTNGKWHNLYIEHYNKPTSSRIYRVLNKGKHSDGLSSLLRFRIAKFCLKELFNPVFTNYMESKVIRKLIFKYIYKFIQ